MITKKLLSYLKSQLFGLSILLFSASVFNNAYATISNITSTTFSCDSIYAGTDNGVWVWSGTGGTMTKMYTQNTTPLANTIALGWSTGRDTSGSALTMYGWNFDNGNTLTKLISGQTTDTQVTTNLGTPWAGGEVNQLTGEIYMGSFYAGYMSAPAGVYRFKIAVFNPNTGAFKKSSQLVPATTSDALTSGQDYVASDMAIDAEGNAYIIAGPYAVGTKYLLKVIPGEDNATWKYTKVATLNNLPNPVNIWGMAFFNGELFAVAYPNQLYRINVLTGNSTTVTLTGSGMGDIRDLAACQVAPVIKGKVYNDTTGEGNITGSEDGLSGIIIQLWKGGTWYKSFVTGDTGEYSFIVDSTNKQDYQIRVMQPKINNVNAVQTWATSDSTSVNPVTAYCMLGDGTINKLTSDGPCRGSGMYATDPITTITDGYIYSEVTMNSDAKVANASFALTTASNFGDAPSSYNNSTSPARHIAPGASGSLNTKINWLRLGDTVAVQTAPQPSADANLIASHDGIEVSPKGETNYVSLQDALLVSGNTYTFRAKTMGPASSKGYLNGWIDWSSSQSSGSFGTTQIVTDQSGVNNGYVTFDYTVPAGSATSLHTTYARFRFSTTQGLGPNNDTLPTPSATVPWVVDGEVEDYRLYITPGSVKLSAISKGGVGAFTYSITNVSDSSPSSMTDSITTVTNGTKLSSSTLHAFSALNQAVVITQTLPSDDWETISAECLDGTSAVSATLSGNVLTIPASSVKEGANLSCTFTNGLMPKVKLSKSISGNRFNANDQFTVQLKDNAGSEVTSASTTGTASTIATNATKVNGNGSSVYTLSEVMATGSVSALARYNTEMSCTNSYTSSSTSLPSGAGQTFNVTPNYGDNIECTLTNTSIAADPNNTNTTIKANPTSVTADGTTESTITVQLADSNGNKLTVGGDKVEVFFTDTANKLGSINKTTQDSVTATDNNDGTYTVKITSTKTGSDTFSFKLNDVTAPATKVATVTYTAGKVDTTKAEITSDKESITADDTELATITVKLKDAQGNYLTSGKDPVTGKDYTVKLTIADQKGILQPTTGLMTNNKDGSFTAYVKSTQSGSDTIGFTVDDTAASDTVTVIYNVGAPDIGSSEITATKPSIVADSVDSSTVTVTLKDKFGNQLTSGTDPSTSKAYNLVISIKNSPAVTQSTITTTNNGDGTFSAKVTSEKTGVDTFTFKLDDVQATASTDITYTPGKVDLTKSTINAEPKSITADGTAKSTVTVQLKDKFNNSLTTQSGTINITGVNIATQKADKIEASYIGNGKYTIELSSTKSGTDSSIGFTLTDSSDVTTTGSDTTSVTYTAGSLDLTQSTISLSKSEIIADNTDSSIVTIQLKDANGNNLTASGGTVVLVFNDGTTTKVGIDSTVTDNLDGSYTATMKSTQTGSDTIGFTVAGNAASNTKVLNYTPGAVDLTQSTIVAKPVMIEANDSDTSTITVQLKDKYGNNLVTNEGVVTLYNYTYGVVNKGNSNGDTLTYKGNGYYEGTVTSTKTGTDTFKFKLGETAGTKSADVTYKTGGPSLSKSTITASNTSITADDVMESTITVQLKDQFENNITTQQGNVYFVDLNTGYPSLGKTNIQLTYVADGRYEAKIKSTKSGFDNIGYKLGETESAAENGTDHVTVTYTAGDIDFSKSTIVAIPAAITANDVTKSTITVQLKDKFSNNITTDQGAMVLSDLTIGKPNKADSSLTYQTDGTYTATVTSVKTGTDATIGFTLTGKGSGSDTTSITYTPGPVNLAKSEISATPTSITANYSDVSTVTIQFKDAYGNNLSGDVTGTVALTDVTTGEVKTALKSIGNGAYQATVYSKKAGSDDIKFTLDGAQGGTGTTAKATVTYTPGAADLTQSDLSVNPASIVANGVTTSKITLTLKDANGNPLTAGSDKEVKIFISSSTISGTIDRLSNFTNVGDGTYTATVKSKISGTDTITFSIDNVASTTEKTVTYTAGAASAEDSIISATPSSIVADDTATSVVTVQLRDENGNNLTSSIGKAVSISSPEIGIMVGTAVQDNSNGTYSITVKSKKTGTDTFTFSVLGTPNITNNATVTYTPGAVDLSQSTIVASPDTIIADGVEKTTVTVQLKDKFKNNLTTNVGKVELTGVNTATEGNIELTYNTGSTGSYSGTLSSTNNGSDSINFKLDSVSSTATPVTVTYKSGGASLVKSTIDITPSSITANGTDVATITIQLKDKNDNNTDNGEIVTLTGIGTNASDDYVGQLVSFSKSTNGKWVGTVKSTKSGYDTISFKIDDVQSQNNKTVTYVAGPASTTQSVLTVTPSTITADNGVTKATVSVQLKDANGNNVIGAVSDAVTLVMPTPAFGLSDNLTMSYNTSTGVYTTEVYSKQTGTDLLKYKLGTNVGDDSKNITYTAGPVSLTESIITATPDSITANGTDLSVISVQLKDQYGNNLNSNPGAVTLLNLKTGKLDVAMAYKGNGRYEAKISSEVSGSDTLGYTIAQVGDGTGTNSKATVTYVPGAVSLSESLISASPKAVVADDTTTSLITVQLKDAKGNSILTNQGTVIITGVDKTQIVDGGGTNKDEMSYIGDGKYQVKVKSKVAGSYTVGFTLGGTAGDNTDTVTFTAGEFDLSQSTISASKSEILANGTEESVITVQLKDKFGNNLTTQQGAIVVTGVTLGVIDKSTNTSATSYKLSYDANGAYTGRLTSTKTGTDTIGFTLDGVTATGKTTSVRYKAGDVDITQALISATPASIVADGVTTSTITVQLRDKYGNNLDSDIGKIALTGINTGTKPTDVNDVSHTNGTYMTTVTSTKSGSDSINFTLTLSSGGTLNGPKAVTVAYTAGSIDPSKSSIEIDKSSIIADDTDSAVVTVTLRDKNENLVTGAQVQLQQGGDKVGTSTAITPTQDGIFTYTIKSSKTGSDTFTYEYKDKGASAFVAGTGSVSITYKPGDINTANSKIEVDKTLITANGSDKAVVTVTLKDANSNLVTGSQVGVRLVQAGDKVGTSSAVTPAGNGIFTFNVTSYLKGSDEFTYEYNVDTSDASGWKTGSGKVTVSYGVALEFADKSSISASPTSIIADGKDKSVVTVKMYQATDDSQPLSGLSSSQLTLVLKDGGTATGAFEAASTFEVNPGEYQFIVTSSTVGSDNWTFTTGGTNIGKTSQTITYIPGTTFDTTKSTIKADPTSIVADGKATSTVTVELFYASDNTKRIEGLTSAQLSLFTSAASVGSAVATTPFEASAGVYTFTVTSATVGNENWFFKTVDSKGTETKSTASANIAYTAGTTFDTTKSTIKADPTSIVADGKATSTVTVELFYASDNTKRIEGLTSAQLSLFTSAASVGSAVATTPFEASAGVYTFTVTSATVGNEDWFFKTVDSKGTETKSTASANIAYTAGTTFDTTKSTIKADPTSIVADGKATSTVTVELFYASDNTKRIEGLTSAQLSLFTSAASVGSAVATTPFEASAGVYTFTVTSATVGNEDWFFKTVDSKGTETKSTASANIAYTAGTTFDTTKSTIKADPTSIVADGKATSTVTVELFYASDNSKRIEGLTSAQLSLFTSAASVGSAVATTPFEASAGVYTFTVTSATVGNEDWFFKTVDSKGTETKSTASANIAYTAGTTFDTTKSTIKADPTSIVADGKATSTVTVELFYASDSSKRIEGLTSAQLSLFTSAASVGSAVATTPFEASAGVYTFTVTSATVGNEDWFFKTVDSKGTETKSTASANIAYTAGTTFDTTKSTIKADPTSIVADGKATSTVTVELFYASDNSKRIEGLTSAQLSLFTSAASVGSAVATTPFEASAGVYTFTVTSATVGNEDWFFKTVDSKGTETKSTASANIAYTAGTTFDTTKSTIKADPTSIVADGKATSTVTVELFYASDNTKRIEGLTSAQLSLFTSAASVGSAVATTPFEASAGVYTFTVTSATVGNEDWFFKTVDSKGTETKSTASANIAYTAGTTFDTTKSTIKADPTSIVADGKATSTVTVELFYASDNTKRIEGLTSAQLSLFTSAASVGSAVATTPFEASAGVYTFTVTSATVGNEDWFFKTVDSKGTETKSTASANIAYTAGTTFDTTKSTIKADPTSIVADGKATSTVTVELFYASDNSKRIEGLTSAQLSLFTSAASVGSAVATTPFEASAGVYTFTVTSATVGNEDWFFKTVDSKGTETKSTASANIAYTAGTTFDTTKSTIKADPTSIVADGKATSTVTVELFYASDSSKRIEGLTSAQLSLFTSAASVGSAVATTPFEASAGVYTFTVTSATVGNEDWFFKTVDSKGTETKSTASANIAYTAGTTFDTTKSTIKADPTSIVADGKATSTVTVELFYASDNSKRIEGLTSAQLSLFTSAASVGSAVATTPFEASAGVYTFTVTSATVGNEDWFFKTVDSKGTETKSTASANIAYTAGTTFDTTKSTIKADPTSIVADGKATSTVTVELFYASDSSKRIEGLTSAQLSLFTSAASVGSAVATTPFEASAGVYTFTVTSATVGNEDWFFKTVDSKGTETKSTASANIAYTAGTTFDTTKSTIKADPTSIVADGKATSTVTVELFYASDSSKRIEGLTSAQLSLFTSAASVGSAVATTPFEASAGVYTFTVTSATVGNEDWFFKTVDSKGTETKSTASANIAYTAGTTFDTTKSTIKADPTSIVADGKATSTVTVELFYASDNSKRIEGLTSAQLSLFTSAASVGSAVATTPFEASAGVYTFTVTSATVGNEDWFFKTVDSKGTETKSTASANIAYTAGTTFDTTKSTIKADPTSIVADGKATSTVTVELFYASDNSKRIEGLTSAQLSLFTSAASVGSAVATTPFEASAGVYTFTVTSATVGNEDWFFKTVDSKGTETKSTASANIAYTAGTTFDTTKSTIKADPTSIVADGKATSTVTVELFYASDNSKRIEGLTSAQLSLFTSAASVGSAVATTPFEASAGVYTFTVTSATVGNEDWFFKTVDSKGTETKSTASANIAYTAGTTFDTTKSTIKADPTSIVADGKATSTVTVELFYASDSSKRIEGLTSAQLSLFTSAASVGSAVATTPFEASAGVYTFTVTSATVGNEDWFFKTVDSKGTETKSTASANIAYTAGTTFDTTKSTIKADPTSIVADGKATSTVTVELFYASDSSKRIEGLTSAQLSLFTSAASVGSAVATTPFEASAGVYTFTVTSATVGNEDWFFKTVDSKGTETKSTASANIAYTAGTTFDTTKSTIKADPTSIVADGKATSTVTVELFYASDNSKRIEGLTSAQLSLFTSAASVGSAVATTPFEASAGVYTFTVTSATVGNEDWFFKTVDSKGTETKSTASANIAYTAGTTFDTTKSTIKADPTSIVADGKATSTVTVELFYASDNTKRIEGLTSAQLSLFTSAASVGSAVATTPFEASAGVYTFTVTSATVGNEDWFFKTVDSKGTETKSTASANIAYTAGTTFDTTKSTIKADPTSIVADGKATSTVTVELFYASDNSKRIEGLTSAQLSLFTSAASVGSAVATTPFEASAGVYTFTVTSATVGNEDWFFKTVDSDGVETQSTSSVNIAYTAGTTFDTTKSTIKADPTSIVADGKATSTVTVELFYASDNTKRIEGLTSAQLSLFTSAASVGSAVATTPFEASAGVYTFTVTSATVGNDDWFFRTVGSNGTETKSTTSVNITYSAGTEFDTTKSTIVANRSSIAADNIEEAEVTVELFYASDSSKRITGLTSTDLSLFVASGTPVGTYTPAETFEPSAGVYKFIVKSDTVGTDEWQFKAGSTNSIAIATINYETDAELLLTVSTKEKEVKIGDVVLFTITAENKGKTTASGFSILESLPAGFSYVANSAALTENPRGNTLSVVGNSPLSLENLSLNSGEKLTLKVILRVGAGVKPGTHKTYVEAFSSSKPKAVTFRSFALSDTTTSTTTSISNRASATLVVSDSDPLFSESLIVGTVYHDRNGNGIQDADEPGIPGVKIVSAEGLIITTDQYGRYHLEGISGGKWDRGRNYILKVDPSSLPEGTNFVSNNPLVRRITPGLPVRFDFGVQLPQAFIMEVSDKLFENEKSEIKAAYTNVIKQMAEGIKSNNIKEVIIVTEVKQPLSIQREDALRALLSAYLGENHAVIVSSMSSAKGAK